MKKWDKIIIVSVLALAVICFALSLLFGGGGKQVIISQNNKVVYEGSLFEEKTVNLDSNVIKIENGKALMQSADCKNQICVNHKEISKKGESIICLPNSVIVEIK